MQVEHTLRSLVAPHKEGPADIQIYQRASLSRRAERLFTFRFRIRACIGVV